MEKKKMQQLRRTAKTVGWLSVFLLAAVLVLPVFGAEEKKAAEPAERFAQVEEKWGVKPLNIRLTGSDHFLDFRILITDSEKAKPVLDRGKKAYLMDQESGKIFNVPVTKLGPMRGTTVQPKEGKQYVILFSNSDKSVQRGAKVAVVIGDFKAENLTVE
jgi:hypothetical protein